MGKSIQQLIEKWEQELNVNGFIQNEGELLQHLQTINIDEEEERIFASTMLTIAALSKAAKEKDRDTLVLPWLEKAQQLNPQNLRAKEYLARYEWIKSKDFLAPLTFPPIREADTRQAKRKTVEHYLFICRDFLKSAEEHLENLTICTSSLSISSEYHGLYQQMIIMLGELIQVCSALLKATREFEESIAGSFYTSQYFEEMKAKLIEIEELKKKWLALFTNVEVPKEEKTHHALQELDEMIGLTTVKQRMNNFYQFFKYQKARKEKGFQTKDEVSLNMIITGNPGTGKTTLARALSKIYYELGVLPGKEVVETDRSQLVGGYVGQTEENVRAAVERALGGVLFIDEAYLLKREGQSGNDYGQTAIDTLVSLMTSKEYGGKFAVILAGYPDEMRLFLESNPGLRSRFPTSNHISLPDYSNDELMQIGERLARDNDYVMTDEAKTALIEMIEKERVDDTFGNARTVRNLVLDAIFRKGAQQASGDDWGILPYTLLEKKDFVRQEEKSKRDLQQKLDALIGLHNVKEEVLSIIAFVKTQKMRQENGLPVVPIQLHSVFTGNPGTGKTTVATIFAEFLKECGLLKRGHLIVTSRADFVAGYVGQTAIKTKRKIREALGGVLFIDEAYSLLSQTSGDFGKEVIDTLVDEMTKHNENLVVILAGYPQEMQTLLESNPGLQSRFKKFIHFADYSKEELLEIMKSYGEVYQFRLTAEAEEFVLEQLQHAVIDGNGRFATNVMNEAIQAQSLRLMNEQDAASFLEKASVIEKTDMEKAILKIRKGES